MSRTALPEGFSAELEAALDAGLASELYDALACSEPSLSVRVNPAKGARVPGGCVQVPWCATGFYLDSRPLFAADPAWHQGRYYVQDASSMALGHIVAMVREKFFDNRADLTYLDACAAPGGKTIAAAEALGEEAFVVANEYDRRRAAILDENLTRYGLANVAVACGPAQRFGALDDAFDIIGVDAPCSGEGMMRKEPEAVRQWSPGLIEQCSRQQRDIVEALWPALKPGGVMIYSTCTFNVHEDEEVVRHLIDTFNAEVIDLDPGLFPGSVGGKPGLRFLPGRVRGEGLYVCVLRKSADADGGKMPRPRPLPAPQPGMEAFARANLLNADHFSVSGTWAVPRRHVPLVERIAAVKGLVRAGIVLGEQKGRDTVPSGSLVLSTAFDTSRYPTFDADYPTAVRYLRGEAITDLPDDLPRGYFIVTYQSEPLGLAKNVGRRANNLYPDSFRLRLGSVPAEAPQVITTNNHE